MAAVEHLPRDDRAGVLRVAAGRDKFQHHRRDRGGPRLRIGAPEARRTGSLWRPTRRGAFPCGGLLRVPRGLPCDTFRLAAYIVVSQSV